jgi:hypothetical protein
MSVFQDLNRDHEGCVDEVCGFRLPRSREPVDLGDVPMAQHLESERLKVALQDEVLGLRLLAIDVRRYGSRDRL